MKNKVAYKTRHIRMAEDEWKRLKQIRKKTKLSWNLFIKKINDEYLGK